MPPVFEQSQIDHNIPLFVDKREADMYRDG